VIVLVQVQIPIALIRTDFTGVILIHGTASFLGVRHPQAARKVAGSGAFIVAFGGALFLVSKGEAVSLFVVSF